MQKRANLKEHTALRLSGALLGRMQEIALSEQVSRSEIMRHAMRRYVEDSESYSGQPDEMASPTTTAVRVPGPLLAKIQQIAKGEDVGVSEIIRDALYLYDRNYNQVADTASAA